MGRAVPMMAAALSTYLAGVRQIVLVGEDSQRDLLARAVGIRYMPFTITIDIGDEQRPDVASTLPWLGAMKAPDDGAAAYVCRDFACQAPVTTVEALEGMLS